MKTTPLIMAAALVASAMVLPVAAQPPGHFSLTYEFLVFSTFDFKQGVGVQDPNDPDNPCTFKLLGVQFPQPLAETWHGDQNWGTNLNGPRFAVSDQGLGKPGGEPLVPCPPILGSPPGNLFLNFDGFNWYSVMHKSYSEIYLCTQKTQTSSSPGCLPMPDTSLRLWASACGDGVVGTPDYRAPLTTFYHDYKDAKGKEFAGAPYDLLSMKNDINNCRTYHGHDYTAYVQFFDRNIAGMTFDIIKNEEVVHNGEGSTYMAVCWQISYLNFSTPTPNPEIARTHDWKLILDVGTPTDWPDAKESHFGSAQLGDTGNPAAPTAALRGFYSHSPTADGENGFGPCSQPLPDDEKKPDPII